MKDRRAALIKQLAALVSKAPTHWKYYVGGLLLISVGFIITCQLTLFGFLLGIPIFGLGCFLCFLSSKFDPKSIKNSLSKRNNDSYQRNINTDGGNYNEHISGDYINIQGNQIYVGQDLTQFTAQIQEVLEHLRAQDYSREKAEKQILQELTTELYENLRFRQKVFRWKNSLRSSTTHAEEITERLVQIADEIPKGVDSDSNLAIEGKYKLLHDLLEAGQWKEADEETARFLYDLMPEDFYGFRRTINVNEIPPGALKTINKLWIKYSKGRFGFSVQQLIWKRISSTSPHQKDSWKNERAYADFIKHVGWSFEDGRLYYTDLQYSLTAPPGHLPATVMFEDANPYFYSYSPNYCHLNQKVFDALMERQYEFNSFIPSWLRYWFPEE